MRFGVALTRRRDHSLIPHHASRPFVQPTVPITRTEFFGSHRSRLAFSSTSLINLFTLLAPSTFVFALRIKFHDG